MRVPPDAVIDTVLFDWRQTIFADEDDPTWIRNSAASIGRTLEDEEVAAMIERLQHAEQLPEISEQLRACDHDVDVHRDAMLAFYRAAEIDDELAYAIWLRDGHPDSSFPYPDTAEVFAALSERGCRIGVVSDIHYDIRDHFRRHNLGHFVSAYVLSFEHGFQKPDLRMFTTALEELDARPEDALMVGDRPDYDGIACAAGIASLILPATTPSARRGLDLVLRLVG